MTQKPTFVSNFEGVLKTLRSGEEYRSLPPVGPPEELPSLNEKEMEELYITAYGKRQDMPTYAYHSIKLIEEDYRPIRLSLPTANLLNNKIIWGIDGSNQRIDRSSFHLLLGRASIVRFRYSQLQNPPHFGVQHKDLSGVLVVDGNVFTDEINLHTQKLPKVKKGTKISLLQVIQQGNNEPLLIGHNPEVAEKSPKSQALGWAVKMQQALELDCLFQIEENGGGVCIRDGPLFSTSTTEDDTIQALHRTQAWENTVLVACSKRISDSSLLIELLLKNTSLRNKWFPKPELTDSTLKSVPTDSIILSRLLKPGFRTPLFAAIPRARKPQIDANEELTPLACYYLRRLAPHVPIRMEVPKFMWDTGPEEVKQAIEIVAWQHELGGKAPSVLLFADERCQLQSEIERIRKMVEINLETKDIRLPEGFDD